MAITLGMNIASLRGQRQLAQTSAGLNKVFERLSSGQRINRASDDAAGISVASSLSSDARVFTQGVRNLNDGISALSIAEGALQQLSSVVTRVQELAEQSANGVYTNRQRAALDGEAQALSAEYQRIIESTEFNGRKLLDGTFDNVLIQAGYGLDESIAIGIEGVTSEIGLGTFQSPTVYNTSDAGEMISEDFNQDGITDLFVSRLFVFSCLQCRMQDSR